MAMVMTPVTMKMMTKNRNHPKILNSLSASLVSAEKLVGEFCPKIPIEKAVTPPSSWYTHPSFYALELDRVFYRGWQAVGYTEQIKDPRDFFTGRIGQVEFVVCRDDKGKIHAFHNVCRHHASLLATGTGKIKSCFVCPYHGWTYGLDGTLLKATRVTGIQNFNLNEFGLVPLKVATWGPFILLNVDQEKTDYEEAESNKVANEWLGSCSEMLSLSGVDSSLNYLCRREYNIECNWKVFCDNYLDGGYHVPYAHKGLASGLKLDSYSTTIFEKVSIQRCESGSTESKDDLHRLGSKALYAFIYPNFMINRYGPWMDTNLVIPLGPRKCKVVFDYFIEASLKFGGKKPVDEILICSGKHKMCFETKMDLLQSYYKDDLIPASVLCRLNYSPGDVFFLRQKLKKDDKAFIERSLEDSERVQMEDITLCESVQRGLESPAYCSGRYAPTIETAMHHFHCLLYENLIK